MYMNFRTEKSMFYIANTAQQDSDQCHVRLRFNDDLNIAKITKEGFGRKPGNCNEITNNNVPCTRL